ncbi:flagellar hook-basal body complex protein FliE [Mesorhizobium sp. SP-1A]|jgi:flagellar hook-basal body complex protein FliE|uniref:flagellar hook-basal body complex protein FliE n=1 Tax=Mesorhizobium sp. SP-1A TaxID=3077840 RepID=UPI0028F6D576|nr:flagellar hook-basal body complex protein FliE [Mesorhizobium sp. SP-1A]
MIGGIGAIKLRPAVGDSAASDLMPGGAAATGGAAAGTPATFAEALGRAASRTVDTLHTAESMSVQALTGGADTRQVVDAVMDAQQALQTTIAIRDKIVSAWLDVSRMQI